ncbi:MAG: hypothetical protein FWF96_01850 [Kiritimatiellaeota bacterium]|nr:hypothetical protein [Kiritimatiellota bacterium]
MVDNALPGSVAASINMQGSGNLLKVENAELVVGAGTEVNIPSGSNGGNTLKAGKKGLFHAKNALQLYGRGDCMEADGGTILVEGYRLYTAAGTAGTTNTIRAINGGHVKNKTAWHITASAGRVIVEAIGANPETGKPSLCEPTGTSAAALVNNYTLRAALGGVLAVTNGANNAATATITLNTVAATPEARAELVTAGGEIICGTLTANAAGNGFAPVVTATHGTGKVVVKGTATFDAETWVWPSAEKGAQAGEHIILDAGTLIGAPLLAPGVDTSVWRLREDDNKLYLRYSRLGTLFMLK